VKLGSDVNSLLVIVMHWSAPNRRIARQNDQLIVMGRKMVGWPKCDVIEIDDKRNELIVQRRRLRAIIAFGRV